MITTGIVGFAFTLIFLGLIVYFTIADRKDTKIQLRVIPAINKLQRAIGLAVEAGSRLHISIGRGNLTGSESAAAFAGINILERLTRSTSTSDNPPVATTGDAALAVLMRDTLNTTYHDIGIDEQYDPTTGRLVGLTPFSYAAGTMSIIRDEKASAHIFLGHFGSEVALLTDAGERNGDLTLAGTDNLPAQAILYATAQEPLVGEEVYAGGAYLGADKMHLASLKAQDIIRWILAAVILGSIAAKIIGLDQLLLNILGASQ
ncbi:MAG: DUF6754 domain-containing protein [Chloroflexota bacterium]